jgi:ABC-type transport system involved in cytochrome bd biosynthesis fused ATPase/permease subunit
LRGQMIIFVAHRLETLRDCDTVVELDRGKVVCIGSADMILDGVLEAIGIEK